MDVNIEKFISFLVDSYPNLSDIYHTFELCSKYDGNNYLVNSKIKTINFDKLTEWCFNPQPQSADSLSFSDSQIYLIEFKSGDPTTHSNKIEKLIRSVIGKINDSDSTLMSLYYGAFQNSTTRISQNFCLVIDSKQMGISAISSTLARLSRSNNNTMSSKEKIVFDKVHPDLKDGVNNKDHFLRIDIWFSELFEQYLKKYKIKDISLIDA